MLSLSLREGARGRLAGACTAGLLTAAACAAVVAGSGVFAVAAAVWSPSCEAPAGATHGSAGTSQPSPDARRTRSHDDRGRSAFGLGGGAARESVAPCESRRSS
eukprot:2475769-Prymnesium_polylepis.1